MLSHRRNSVSAQRYYLHLASVSTQSQSPSYLSLKQLAISRMRKLFSPLGTRFSNFETFHGRGRGRRSSPRALDILVVAFQPRRVVRHGDVRRKYFNDILITVVPRSYSGSPSFRAAPRVSKMTIAGADPKLCVTSGPRQTRGRRREGRREKLCARGEK